MARATALWHDRNQAGRALAERLMPWRRRPDALVLGMPHRAFDLVAISRAAPVVFDPFGILPAGPNVIVV